MNSQGLHRGLMLLVFVALAGCAGGGETGTGAGGKTPVPTPIPTPTPPPVAKKVLSVGAITKLGSVWVNGVEFQTSAATLTIDGVSATTASLDLGMVAAVKGTINADLVSGTADTIVVTKAIKGQVDQVNGGLGFTVLDQSVQVDEQTVFGTGVVLDPAQLATTVAGLLNQYVEVSGVVKSTGVIVATRVDVKVTSGVNQVSGVIATLDGTTKTFEIGNLKVNYVNVATPPAALTLGDLVEVRGVLTNGVFMANTLERAALAEQDVDRIEMQGCVAGASPDFDSFALNSTIVLTPPGTVFSGGFAEQIVNGICLEVEGSLVKGEVTAAHITLKNKARVESNITTIDAVTKTFTLLGLDGLTIMVNNDTKYFVGSTVVTFNQLVLGYGVKVRGRYDPSTETLLATDIIIGNAPSKDIIVRNYVDALNAMSPTITLLGVPFDVSVDSVTGYPHFTGGGLDTSELFFQNVLPGYLVMLEGRITNGVVSWQSIDYLD